MKIFSQKTVVRGDAIPVVVTLIVAVVGTAGILFNDFGTGNRSQGSNASMITAAAVAKAGAIQTPSRPANWG
jgi:hypothetical protein